MGMRNTVTAIILLAVLGVAVWMIAPDGHKRQVVNLAAASVEQALPEIILPEPRPELARMLEKIEWQKGNPVYIRIFKLESQLELYGRHGGEWVLLKTYDICNWSGELGPKHREGDGQSPEGFYVVGKRQLNPNSSYHLSFNLGFPNAVEQAQGRTGSYLMVHGNCVSIGCYAMTDEGIEEIYAIVEEALQAGQDGVAVHAFPFRMTDAAMQEQKDHPEMSFWQTLKPGFDRFEESGAPPAVFSCGDRYRIEDAGEPSPQGCKPLRMR